MGGQIHIKTNLGAQDQGLSYAITSRSFSGTCRRGHTSSTFFNSLPIPLSPFPDATPGGALEVSVSSNGVVAAGTRPGFAVIRVTYQASEVQQSEVIQLRVAYVSHVSLVPVRSQSGK